MAEVSRWALRRCCGLPKDVDEVDHPGYKTQFARGLSCAGVDRWNYTWPGIGAIMDAVGRPAALA